MLSKDSRKYFTNPILGLIPFLVYLIIFKFTQDTFASLLPSILLSVIFDLSIRYYTKSRACGLMFEVTFIAAVLSLIGKFFLSDYVTSDGIFAVFYEMWLVLILLTLRLFRPAITRFFFRKKNPIEKVFLNEFYEIAGTVQYFFILHIFALHIIKYIANVPPAVFTNLYTWIPIGVIVVLMIVEGFKIKKIADQLRREKWLPIVNERGEVSGKIAYSETRKLGNKFMHPVLRIALISGDKIYLQERASKDDFQPKRLDHPFERFILFDEDINLKARETMSSFFGAKADIRLTFSFKYVYEDEKTKRLIFLFIANAKDENNLPSGQSLKGKFWSIKQIEDNFVSDDVFSECYLMEHEYLKNTLKTLALADI